MILIAYPQDAPPIRMRFIRHSTVRVRAGDFLRSHKFHSVGSVSARMWVAEHCRFFLNFLRGKSTSNERGFA